MIVCPGKCGATDKSMDLGYWVTALGPYGPNTRWCNGCAPEPRGEVMDTTNKFLVSTQGEHVVVMLPLPPRLTREEALNLAAYLVGLADMNGEFDRLRQAVEEV